MFDSVLNTLDRLHENSNDVSINLTKNSKEDLTTVCGCLAPQINFNESWDSMEHLFHEQSDEAIPFFIGELKKASVNSSVDDLAELVNQCDGNWDFIEKFPHLFQVF